MKLLNIIHKNILDEEDYYQGRRFIYSNDYYPVSFLSNEIHGLLCDSWLEISHFPEVQEWTKHETT